MYIHHAKKCVFIHIPKCGGTFIGGILTHYFQFEKMDILFDWRRGSIEQKIKDIDLHDYTFFTCVRNPYERIVSSYLYLLERGLHTFDSFSDFVIQRESLNNIAYCHSFISMTEHLHNFNIHYIAYLSNIERDICYILTKCGFDTSCIEYDRFYSAMNKNNLYNDTWITYYADVADEGVATEVLDIIHSVFELDFKTFGFSLKTGINNEWMMSG